MNNNDKIRKMCLDFLIDCYFGQSEDLLKAAIDRAYIDMASHTLIGFKDDTTEKWRCRYDAYAVIRDFIELYPKEFTDFTEWRENILKKIESIYINPMLKRGQAEKWLDMTIKYLYVFKILIDERDDKRFEFLKGFLFYTDENDYQPPVDSYIIKVTGLKYSWSLANKSEMEAIRAVLGDDKDFLWELKTWGKLKKKYRSDDGNSYNVYFDKREKELNEKHK